MTLLDHGPPPLRAPVADHADALIRDARRRARRRRGRAAGAVVVAAVAAGFLATGGGGGGSTRPHPGGGNTPASAAGRQASPKLAVAAFLANALWRISFVSPRHGYGLFTQQGAVTCTDLVAETTDGGAHFASPVRVTSYGCSHSQPVSALTFDDQGDGFLYGPLLYVTHDGGRSWAREPQPGSVIAVSAVGPSIWMVETVCAANPSGGGAQRCALRLLESADGGRDWTQSRRAPAGATTNRETPAVSAQGQNWLVRVGATAAYLLSEPTATRGPGTPPATAPLWYTGDGGASWTARHIVCREGGALSVVLSAAPDGALVAVCAAQPSAGYQPKSMSVSTDGGRTWSLQGPCRAQWSCTESPLDNGYLDEVVALSADTAFVIGPRSPILVTRDGGASWQARENIGDADGALPGEVVFFDSDHGVVLGSANTAAAPVTIWRTSDGGRNWSAVLPSVS
jgi:photosystem II stability/assembly factor-like uncharacterized protein